MSGCHYQEIQLIGGWQQAQLQQTVKVGGHQDVRNVCGSFSQPVGDGRSEQGESVHLGKKMISAVRTALGQARQTCIFIKLPIVRD